MISSFRGWFSALFMKKIMRERKQTRHDLGQEKFESEVSFFPIFYVSKVTSSVKGIRFNAFIFCNKVWNWRNEYGGKILKQQRHLGASMDWSREVWMLVVF